MAHKHVGGGGEGFGSRQFEGALHDPCEGAYDALQDSEVKEQRADGAKENDGRKHLKGKQIAERVHAAHEITKQKERALSGVAEQRHKTFAHGVKGRRYPREVQDCQGQHELQQNSFADKLPVDGAAVG